MCLKTVKHVSWTYMHKHSYGNWHGDDKCLCVVCLKVFLFSAVANTGHLLSRVQISYFPVLNDTNIKYTENSTAESYTHSEWIIYSIPRLMWQFLWVLFILSQSKLQEVSYT